MPPEIAIFGIYVSPLLPTLLLLSAVYWVLDTLLAHCGLYQRVWHPSLFRLSLFILIYAVLGLALFASRGIRS